MALICPRPAASPKRTHTPPADSQNGSVGRGSTDGGRTWQPADVMLQKPEWAISPQHLYPLRDGSVWACVRMLKVAGDGKGAWRNAILRSTDLGRTWQQVSDEGGYIACEMSNGELLWLCGAASPHAWGISVRATRTSRWSGGNVVWSETRPHPELGPTSDEWMVAETDRPGELVCMMRQQQHSHYYATAKSFDYGRTWTPWRDSNVFMGPIPCRPSIRSMGDGRLVSTYGQRYVGRTFAVVSRDRGETWDVANRQVILHSPHEYHWSHDSHYTDIAWAEGRMWLAVDYIASPRNRARQRGIYGTFLDERFFRRAYAGVQLRHTAPIVCANTIGLWSFDEPDGAFARDAINGNYGEIHGAQRGPGRLGGALQFDGHDDYVLVYDDASVRLPRWFGIAAWIQTRDAGKDQTILSRAPAAALILRQGVPVLEIGGGHATAQLAQPLESGRPFDGMIDSVLLHGGALEPPVVRAVHSARFVEKGTVESIPIERSEDARWTTFDARVTEPEGSRVRFSIQNATGAVVIADAPAGQDLRDVDARALVLRAELVTSAPGRTPVLHEWSLGVTAGTPWVTAPPFPEQSAAPAGGKMRPPPMAPAAETADEGAVRSAPTDGIPVNLYRMPVGSKATLTFELQQDPAQIAKAWLEMLVDDIDEPKEATITLNGTHAIEINASVLGEGEGARGALVVPRRLWSGAGTPLNSCSPTTWTTPPRDI